MSSHTFTPITVPPRTNTGVFVNVGNFAETGRFWDMKPCKGPSEESDHPQYGVPELLAPLDFSG